MQGIFLSNGSRPKSKKQVREMVMNSQDVWLEATSLYEYDGPVYRRRPENILSSDLIPTASEISTVRLSSLTERLW